MIIIRADAGPKIGAGHIMRCLSVAESLKRKNEEVVFISADDHAKKIVEEKDFDCLVLGTDSSSPEKDTDLIVRSDAYERCNALITDGYNFHRDFFEPVKGDKKLIYFDDLICETYPADMIINYNIFAGEDAYNKLYENEADLPKFLLGPKYAPLREEFSSAGQTKIKEKAENILILTGGADPCHVAYSLCEEIVSSADSGRRSDKAVFHFVIGALSKDYDGINALSEKCPDIVIHRNVRDMRLLMTKCDMAVSAAGSTLYELCSCSVPTICYTSADNQIEAEKAFSQKGIMLSAGDVRKKADFFKNLYALMTSLSGNASKRAELSKNAAGLVDGKGADRIADEIINLISF